MTIIRWILTGLITLAFLFFGTVKITGQPKKLFETQKLSYVEKYGLSRGAITAIGVCEVAAALAILLWSTDMAWVAQVGHIVLMVVTAGAMYYHNKYDSVTKDGLPAIIQFGLNTALLIWSFL